MPTRYDIMVDRSILNIFLLFVLDFWFYRWHLAEIISYRINKSRRKKIKKKRQTFKEWFLYTRFKKIIPKPWFIFYFVLLVMYLLGFTVSIVSYLITSSLFIPYRVFSFLFAFFSLRIVVRFFMFSFPPHLKPPSSYKDYGSRCYRWFDKYKPEKEENENN